MKLSAAGEGPIVVKVAGVAGGVQLYREEMDGVVTAGYRVAALDTTGDRHDDPARAPLSWDVLAAEVARTVEVLERGPAVLWGTSFGCLVALATAIRHPSKVSGLLLCHPPDPSSRPVVHRALMEWVLRRPDPARTTAVLFRVAFAVLNGWEFLAPSAFARFPALLRESRAAATPASTLLQKLQLLWWDDPGLPPSPPPVSIVASPWDTVTPYAGARRLASRIPGSRLRRLGFSGHAGAYSRPAAYLRLVLEELKDLTAVRY